MNTYLTLFILTIIITFSSFIFTQAHAVIAPNDSFLTQGSGYLASDKAIKTLSLVMILETETQVGSGINIQINNGLVDIDEETYVITSVSSATSLREGKYIRISAMAESINNNADKITITTLGRLVQNSEQGSIYTFTGRIMEKNTEYKIIYTAQLSDSSTNTLIPQQLDSDSDSIVVRILQGASNSALSDSYISKTSSQLAGYFSADRLTITPGTSVTFVNDDDVSHTLVSGTGLSGTRASGELVVCAQEDQVISGSSYSQNNCDFTLDGRLNSGVIEPGASWNATFEERGFYRLIDIKYPWMNLVSYVFPESDSSLIRQGNNRLGN